MGGKRGVTALEAARRALEKRARAGEKLSAAELKFLSEGAERGPKTQDEVAGELGIARRTLQKYREMGCPGLVKPFDVGAARRWMAEMERGHGRAVEAAVGIEGGAGRGVWSDLPKIELEKEEIWHRTQLRAVSLAKARGEVMATATVQAELGRVFRRLQDVLFKTFPREVVAIVHGAKSDAVASARVADRLREVLTKGRAELEETTVRAARQRSKGKGGKGA